MKTKSQPWLVILPALVAVVGCESAASIDTSKIDGGGGTSTTSGSGGSTSTGACVAVEDCPTSASACLVWACEEGHCKVTPASEGTTCDDSGGVACNGFGTCVACLASKDCPKPSTTCLDAFCGANTCGTIPVAAGASCADNGGKLCDGAGHCVTCNSAVQCPPQASSCVVNTCYSGACGTASAAAYTVCSDNGGKLCDGAGSCVVCNAPDDCPTQPTDCVLNTCTAGACGTVDAALDAACSDSGGVVCDGAGACVECNAGAQCAGYPDNVCDDHQCVPATCTDLLKDGSETDVDCGGGACAGCADGLVCVVSTDCASGFCDNLLCAPCTGHSDCSQGRYCDVAAGVCEDMQAIATACTSDDQCLSAHCADGVCCDTDCTGTCKSCGLSGSEGTCTDVAGGQQDQGTCVTPSACDGAGLCKSNAGIACTAGAECLSGFCADGVCCNSACNGTCQTCNDLTSLGVCSNVTPGQQDPGTCVAPKACTATGQCLLTDGTACTGDALCSSGHCVDGVCCDTACAGACQACSAAAKGSGADGVCGAVPAGSDPDAACAPYFCAGAGACATSCATDTDCVTGDYCAAAACVPKKPAGTSCGGANECTSGSCVDGVCCNTACSGTCQACHLAGSEGTCTAVPSGQIDSGTCSGTSVCNGAGVCQLLNGQGCTLATQCLSGHCIDGVCCGSASCSGVCQSCDVPGSAGTCAFVLSGQQDPTTCASTGNACNGSGACVKVNGYACGAAGECLSGICVDGTCCDSACAGTCQACNISNHVGTCINVPATVQDTGCSGINACDGAGNCLLDKGVACTVGTACASGFCVDGVCCNNACAGTCLQCDLAGSLGTCDNVPSGQTDTTPDCSGNNVCDGDGQCLWKSGMTCTSNAECASGVCTWSTPRVCG